MAKRNRTETKKARHEANVKKLDGLGTNINEFILQEGFSAIEEAMGNFIERVLKNIDSIPKLVDTGAIADITLEPSENEISIMGYSHLIYQDRGCSGTVTKRNTPHGYTDKKPPVQRFINLIKSRNLKLRDNEKKRGDGSPFKELTEDQRIKKAAWGMVNNVYKHGYPAQKIYSHEIPALVEECEKLIVDFCIQAVIQNIDVKPSAQRIILPMK